MLRLYGSGRSRWVRPLWMLREIDVPFEAVTVDRAAGELDTPAFRALNPTGRIPVLVDDGRAICESGAILLYLGDRFPDRGLVPTPGTWRRGRHDQWMFTIVTEFEAPIWRLHKHAQKGVGDRAAAELARREIEATAPLFEEALTTGRHLMGERFTAADIMLTHLLTWRVMRPLMPAWPALEAYRDRLTARPAFPAWLYRGD